VRELLGEWIAFRIECVRRRTYYDLSRKRDKMHLLQGLRAILLDIDKAVRIVRETEEESEVVPNLMIGFGIDEAQAEYVAEIKLRHLNREYILKRTEEIEQLQKEIEELETIFNSKAKIQAVIVQELRQIIKNYGRPRRSMLLYADEIQEYVEEEEVADYPVHLFFTRDGYFKKITPQSLRMSGEQKLKEGDEVIQQVDGSNSADLLFFTDRQQVYKAKAAEFADTKASVLGEYIPARLGMEEGETVLYMAAVQKYAGYMLFFFENGKAAKVDMEAYATKNNRKKLVNAYSGKAPVTAMFYVLEDTDFLLMNTQGRVLLVHTGAVSAKATRSTQGVQVMTLKKNVRLREVKAYREGMLKRPDRYRKAIPATGSLLTAEETAGEQLSLLPSEE